jgi:hypothetical protein
MNDAAPASDTPKPMPARATRGLVGRVAEGIT